ncbi:MAG: polymer-forming cytoskeletal protein [Bacteroidales bacterium]
MSKRESEQLNEICRLSPSSKIVGELTSESAVRIDGEFEGTIYTKDKVVIGENAHVKGVIVCTNLDLWGFVDGIIITKELTSFKSTADFKGEVNTAKISVGIGAKLNCACKTINEAEFKSLVSKTIKTEEKNEVKNKAQIKNK